jgi:hypothetical protein
MSKQKIRIIIPLIVIAAFVIYTWCSIIFTDYAATWRHYIGLVGFLILVFLFFKSQVAVVIASAIFLLLATFNVLAITATITTSGITIMSISTPPIQLLSLGILILYFILNFNRLIDIYLDYKEGRGLKTKK